MKSFLVTIMAMSVLATPKTENKSQTHCSIGGHKISKDSYVDYQGQRVYLCCDNCKGKFKKDPEATFKKLEKEGIIPENIQTVCAVSGEKLENKESFADYKGRRLHFCCDGCKKTFHKDPDKYLEKMAAAPKEKGADHPKGDHPTGEHPH